MVLRLLPPPDDHPENHTEVLSPLSGFPFHRTIDAAGHAFEEWACRTLGKADDSDEGSEEDTSGPSSPTSASKKKGKGKKAQEKEKKPKEEKTKKLTEAELAQDHYEMLGLGDKQWRATEEEIKSTYRKLVIKLHPDKPGGDAVKFKAAQMAYEVLSDKTKRLAYDSSLPFDDDLPPAKVPLDRFFEEYGACFQMNSRWSVNAKECPSLGDMNTPYDEVDKFYEFWFHFKSWRDFSQDDEYCVDDAESRDERRWMERENERQRTKSRKEEHQRILTLTERAFKLDPRLKKRRQEELAQKEAEKAAKQKAKEEEEKKRKQEEAAKKKAEEERIAKEKADLKQKKEQAKKMRQQVRQSLDAFISSEYSQELREDCFLKADLDFYLGACDHAELVDFCEALRNTQPNTPTLPHPFDKSTAKTVVGLVNERILAAEQRTGTDRFGNNLKLSKAPVKKETALEKEKREDSKWTEAEILELTKAVVKYPGGTVKRWEQIATFIGTGKTPEQVLRKTKEMTAQLNDGTAPKKPSIIKQGDAKPLAQGEKKKEPEAPPEENVWTKAQQKEFEEALKAHKGYKEKDKWDKIAAMVEGKTKKQCMLRYKRLAELNAKR